MKRRDAGYAMIAAVASIAAFSAVSFQILAVSRGAIAGVSADVERAKLAAAADAGIAMAIHGVAIDDPARRWSIDGRARPAYFDGASVVIRVEDERGKVPVNRLDPTQIRSLFAAVGISGARLDSLSDAFMDWQDDDDQRRPKGAEATEYAALGIVPRNGAFRTIDELAELKGMDPNLFARLKPALTVNFGDRGGFSPDTAEPLAIGVMTGAGVDSPQMLDREKELAGERPALDIAPDENIIGRPLTIRAAARDGAGGYFERTIIVELTGNKNDPFWIRSED